MIKSKLYKIKRKIYLIYKYGKIYLSLAPLEKKYNHTTCILADLQGPKLRIGNFIKKFEVRDVHVGINLKNLIGALLIL